MRTLVLVALLAAMLGVPCELSCAAGAADGTARAETGEGGGHRSCHASAVASRPDAAGATRARVSDPSGAPAGSARDCCASGRSLLARDAGGLELSARVPIAHPVVLATPLAALPRRPAGRGTPLNAICAGTRRDA